MFTYSFEKLEVYQKAMEVSLDLYRLSGSLPRRENFNIISQMDRAVVSITNNIAEGSGRASRREQARFSEIAFGSLTETINLLNWCLRLHYIDEEKHRDLRTRIDEVARMLNGLRKRQLADAKRQKQAKH